MNKIAVFGYKGRLGEELIRRGCIPLDYNITDRENLKLQLEKEKEIEVFINCASKTEVDECERNLVQAYLVNGISPRNIVDFSDNRPVIHISTDFIFDGKVGQYKETDLPDPQNSYGRSKFFGEVGIRNSHNVLIIRTTILYDAIHKKSNFVKTVLNKLKNNEQFTLPMLYGNPTYIPHLVDGILSAIEKKETGILNIVGKDYISRYEFGKHIAKKFGYDESLITLGTAWGDAKRPQYLGLDTTKAQRLGIPIYNLETGLEEFSKLWQK